MYKLQIILTLVIATHFTGCATQTQAQKQFEYMDETFTVAIYEKNQCVDEVKNSYPEIWVSMDALFITKSNDPKVVQKMAIERYMTEPEKVDYLKIREALAPCKAAVLEGMSRIHPDLVTFRAKWYAKSDEETLALIQDKVTIGEHNVAKHKNITKRNREQQNISNNIFQQLSQSHYSEVANRQAAVRSLQQWSYQQQLLLQNQQMINSINRPTVMNCSYFGNGMRCQGQ